MIDSLVRWAKGFGLLTLALGLSGCLIDGPEQPPEFYSWVRIEPGDRFSAGPMIPAPEGFIFQLWVANIDFGGDGGGGLSEFEPIYRFQWDQDNYLALDEDGNAIRLTVDNGMDLGVNVFEWDALMVTIEPLDGVSPLGLGPIILFSNPFESGIVRNLFSPFEILLNFGIPPPVESQFTLISQSNKKNNPGSNWRDGSEGEGIWFTTPEVKDLTINEDSVFQTFQQIIFPPNGPPIEYNVWIHTVYPESSFSNFGTVFANQEVNQVFVDGIPLHSFSVTGIDTTFKTGPQIPLGETPIIENDEIVGYRYFSEDGDVCDLRIDHPWLSHCDSDPFDALIFFGDEAIFVDDEVVGYAYFSPDKKDTCILRWDDPSLSRCDSIDNYYNRIFDGFGFGARQFVTTNGDTTMTQTIGFLPPVALFQFDYEAWLLFTPESGIKPLSLGRFQTDFTIPPTPTFGTALLNQIDNDNRYTFTDERFDQNFHFPGEDFVNNMGRHDPSLPDILNVIEDDRALKLWVTMEPFEAIDWAPDEPYEQLIVLSAWIPKAEFFLDGDVAGDSLNPSPVTRTLDYRNLNPNTDPTTSLNEGNRWPTMKIYLSNEGP